MTRYRFFAALAIVAPWTALAAPNKPAAPPEPQRDFGFNRLEIFAFKDDTSELTIKDIDADGLDDVIFVNNQASRIEVLRRKSGGKMDDPVGKLEDHFVNKGFVVDQRVSRLEVVDMNDDGLLDIVTVGVPYGPQVRFQKKDGTFAEPLTPYVGNDDRFVGAEVVDLNKDHFPEILISRRDELEILWNQEGRRFSRGDRRPYALDTCDAFLVGDLTGDGREDLILYCGGENLALRVIPNEGDGRFSWESPLDLPNIQFLGTLKNGGKTVELGALMKNGYVLRTCALNRPAPVGKLLEKETVAPFCLPLGGEERKSAPPAWVVRDFDDDGYDDLCVSAPDLSRLRIYRGREDGFSATPESVDSLAGVTDLLPIADNAVIAFSPQEKLLARHDMDHPKTFPVILKAPGKPLAVATENERVYLLTEDDDGKKRAFARVEWDAAGQIKDRKEYPVEFKNPPSRMRVFPLDNDTLGVMFFFRYSAPEIYALKKDALTKVPASRVNVLSENTRPELTLPATINGGPALIVCGKNTARAYRWSDDGFTIVRQFNLADNASELAGTCLFDNDGEPGALFYDRARDELAWFSFKNERKPPIKIFLKGGVRDFIGMSAVARKKGPGLAMLGGRDLRAIFGDVPEYALTIRGEYASKAEKPAFWRFSEIAIGGPPPSPKIAVLDRANRSIEILSKQAGTIKLDLAFEVFQEAAFSRGSSRADYEPHDVASGDINGDKIPDLAVLSHDNLILYFGE